LDAVVTAPCALARAVEEQAAEATVTVAAPEAVPDEALEAEWVPAAAAEPAPVRAQVVSAAAAVAAQVPVAAAQAAAVRAPVGAKPEAVRGLVLAQGRRQLQAAPERLGKQPLVLPGLVTGVRSGAQ
jgi:hypothetical protein